MYYNVYLMKLDSLGNEIWGYTYGGTDVDFGADVIEMSDGGFAICGTTHSSQSSFDLYVVKTNSAGQQTGNFILQSDGSDFGYSVVQSLDGKIVVCGFKEMIGLTPGIYNSKLIVVKINDFSNVGHINLDNQIGVSIYPNPTKNYLTIDFGDYSSIAGHIISVTSTTGQQVYFNPINQQILNVDLSTWTGNGVYHVNIIDSQGNIVEHRNIVLQ